MNSILLEVGIKLDGTLLIPITMLRPICDKKRFESR